MRRFVARISLAFAIQAASAGEWTNISDSVLAQVKPGSGKGVLVSRDKGATWTMLGAPVDAGYGPFFDTAKHFVVVGKGGFSETKDSGETWENVAPLPVGFGTGRVGPNYAWDPRANIFYASTMGKPTFKFERLGNRQK